ncbi:MAG: hypothetical protein EOM26_08170 [Alphaproteobacteria bacterium]|nr:hypothetical protein [Alphaproteobacteria bacterium]
MPKKWSVRNAERNYNVAKGRIGEALVEQLFSSLGWDVYPVGFESQLPVLAQLKARGELTPGAISRFENGPDFIIHMRNAAERVHSIEVKFRNSGMINASELQKYWPDNLLFILMDPQGISCLQRSELDDYAKSAKVVFRKCPPLAEHPAFAFGPDEAEIIRAFQFIAKAFFCKLETSEMFRNAYKARGACRDAFGSVCS